MQKYKPKVLRAILFMTFIIGSWSCMNIQSEDVKEIAVENKDAKFGKSSSEEDAQFLVNAAEINIEVISLGKLAQQKGTMNHVKELGKMMEEEHSKSAITLSALAKIKNIKLPISQNESGLDVYKKLKDKSGNDFDRAYTSRMTSGHKDVISLFGTVAVVSTDPKIRAWATATLPSLRTQLDHSIMCQKKCNKMQ